MAFPLKSDHLCSCFFRGVEFFLAQSEFQGRVPIYNFPVPRAQHLQFCSWLVTTSTNAKRALPKAYLIKGNAFQAKRQLGKKKEKKRKKGTGHKYTSILQHLLSLRVWEEPCYFVWVELTWLTQVLSLFILLVTCSEETHGIVSVSFHWKVQVEIACVPCQKLKTTKSKQSCQIKASVNRRMRIHCNDNTMTTARLKDKTHRSLPQKMILSHSLHFLAQNVKHKQKPHVKKGATVKAAELLSVSTRQSWPSCHNIKPKFLKGGIISKARHFLKGEKCLLKTRLKPLRSHYIWHVTSELFYLKGEFRALWLLRAT